MLYIKHTSKVHYGKGLFKKTNYNLITSCYMQHYCAGTSNFKLHNRNMVSCCGFIDVPHCFWTQQRPVEEEIRRRRWAWIGHSLRKPVTSTTRQALTWNPQGKRRRGRPRNTWRQDLQADTRKMGYTWNQLERMAQDRGLWRSVVDGLCPKRGDGHK